VARIRLRDVETPRHLELGRDGETAAFEAYLREGYKLVARNWRCPLGEIDLVLLSGGELVFCEVKTRRGAGLGAPFEAVTARKQRKLRALAQAFLASSDLDPESVRFDVASVTVDARGRPSVHLFDQAF
jgi:putative endonuclease